jgi:hypothetical protein
VADAPVRITTAPPSNGSGHAEPVIDGITTVITSNGDTPEAGEIMCSGRPPAPEAPTTGDTALSQQDHPPADPSTNGAVTENVTAVTRPTTIPTAADLPTRIPAGLQLPCADAWIVDLRPPQLSLLIGKVGLRALADKRLEPLHVALLAERARRFAQGQRAEANGHGA